MIEITTDDGRNPEQLTLDHMGVDKDELGLSTSVLYAHIDDGTWTYIVSVLRMVSVMSDRPCCAVHEFQKDIHHTITRYVLHEVDDMWTYKQLDHVILTDTDLFDGTFEYVDDENEEAGHITWDRSVDPAAEPTVTPDKPYTAP